MPVSREIYGSSMMMSYIKIFVTDLIKALPGNRSVNTFPRIGPCHESGDVINNRDGVFHWVCAEC
jgi:hypothetical protein